MTTALAPPDGRIDAMRVLGTDVSTSPTAYDALTKAGLAGMRVRKVDIQTITGKPIHGQYGLVTCDGAPLHNITVGEGFNVVQFEDNAATLDAVAQRTGAHFATAGALDVHSYGRGGTRAFISMKLPEPITIGDDTLAAYVTAFMSHGLASNHFIPGATRVHCANQQNQMVREGHDYKVTIRHTASAYVRTAMAQDTLVATLTGMRELEIEGLQMLNQQVTHDQFRKIIDTIYPLGGTTKAAQTRYERRLDVIESIYAGPTNAGIAGTAWGAYQALNEYSQWAQNIRGSDSTEEVARARRALTSGSLNATQIRTYNVIRGMFDLAA
jgi:hypothetical protein